MEALLAGNLLPLGQISNTVSGNNSVPRNACAGQNTCAMSNADIVIEEGGGQEDVDGLNRTQTLLSSNNRVIQQSPQKRIVIFSAFLACLSFIIILCNLCVSFLMDLLRDDAFIKMIDRYLVRNNTSRALAVWWNIHCNKYQCIIYALLIIFGGTPLLQYLSCHMLFTFPGHLAPDTGNSVQCPITY